MRKGGQNEEIACDICRDSFARDTCGLGSFLCLSARRGQDHRLRRSRRVEIAGEYGSGNPANPDNEFTRGGEIASNEGGNDFVSQFVIDYVRVYETDGIPFVK